MLTPDVCSGIFCAEEGDTDNGQRDPLISPRAALAGPHCACLSLWSTLTMDKHL